MNDGTLVAADRMLPCRVAIIKTRNQNSTVITKLSSTHTSLFVYRLLYIDHGVPSKRTPELYFRPQERKEQGAIDQDYLVVIVLLELPRHKSKHCVGAPVRPSLRLKLGCIDLFMDWTMVVTPLFILFPTNSVFFSTCP